jgi:Phosphate-starvation-inducible E family
LQEHRVAVDFMVELGIVATLREVVLRGVIELDWGHIVALSGFLLTLGALLRFGDLRALEPPAVREDHEPRAFGAPVDTCPRRSDPPIQGPDVRAQDRADAER